MKTTLLFTADTLAGLSALGHVLNAGENTPQSMLNLISPYQDLLNLLENRIVSASVYHHVMPNGQEYHSIDVLDTDGVTYTVHDRQTIFGSFGEVSAESEFADLQEKARRLDQLMAAIGCHKLRLNSADMMTSFYTLEELYNWLDTDLNKGG